MMESAPHSLPASAATLPSPVPPLPVQALVAGHVGLVAEAARRHVSIDVTPPDFLRWLEESP